MTLATVARSPIRRLAPPGLAFVMQRFDLFTASECLLTVGWGMLFNMQSERGLRHYIEQKGTAMRLAAAARPASSDWQETVEAICTADDATGVRKLRIRDWQIIGDSGPAFGGWGLGPSSPELLCGVVSTCLTHTYLIGAAWLGIAVDRVQVRVSAGNNDARFVDVATDDPAVPYNITARVTLEAPDASAGERETLHRYARERCPLSALIRSANTVTIEVVPA